MRSKTKPRSDCMGPDICFHEDVHCPRRTSSQPWATWASFRVFYKARPLHFCSPYFKASISQSKASLLYREELKVINKEPSS